MPNHIFLSYAHVDRQWTDQLRQALAVRGFDVWMDRERLFGGIAWLPSLNERLTDCSALIAVLSPAFAASSFAHYEVAEAKDREKPIIPVRHSPCVLPPHLEWLNQRQFIDFCAGGFDQCVGKLHEALMVHGVSPVAPMPSVRSPELDQVLPGAWNAVMRNQHGPWHLEGVLSSNNTLSGCVFWPQSGARIPAQGSWRAAGNEVTLDVTQNNLAAGYYVPPPRQSWAVTCHFTGISRDKLLGFTLPDANDPGANRYDCTWTRFS